MDMCCLDRHLPLKMALKEAGFKVVKTGREGKKTVITVAGSGYWGGKLEEQPPLRRRGQPR